MANIEIVNPAGASNFFESVENIQANTHFGIERAFWQSGKDIKGEFNKQVLARNKTGHIYIRRNSAGARRRHRASAPDETPANITGFYRRSFGFVVNQGVSPQLTIGNSAEYAGFLELGTTRMKARPGLLNSINSSQRDIIRNLTTDILSEI